MKKTEIWVYASAALMIVGAFGPWVTVFAGSISGTDGDRDGWVVVAAAALAAAVFYTRREHPRARAIWAMIFGGASAALTFYDRMDAQHIIGGSGPLGQALISIGWGLNLALLASASLVIAALVSLNQPRADAAALESTPEQPIV